VARKVLVTMGGSDPDNMTLLVMHALQQLATKDLDVVVLAGGSNPHYSTLQEAAHTASYAVHLRQNVRDMPELMAWADLCIGAAGSTSWERCLLGLPSLLVVLADNQQLIAEHLHVQGIATNLGRTGAVSAAELARAIAQLAHDADTRAEMMRRGQALVDGRGAERVVMHMRCHALKLRSVSQDDCRLIWEWANDPAARAASFSSAPIPWDEHVRWFAGKMQSQQCVMYLVVDEHARALGQVRFDIEAHDATISISLAPEARGYGCGPGALRLSTQQIFASSSLKHIHAFVKQENEASFRTFLRAGFTMAEHTTFREQAAYHFILTRDHEEAHNYS
jgi:RimJ/RimL family protein N-acetyltransferase